MFSLLGSLVPSNGVYIVDSIVDFDIDSLYSPIETAKLNFDLKGIAVSIHWWGKSDDWQPH